MMEPYWQSQGLTLLHGDCRPMLRSLPERSVQCCVTSPPYWGLRSYAGVEPSVWGGRQDFCKQMPLREGVFCQNGCGTCGCGAWRGHLGAEPTPDLYVQHIVEVFREVKRVLRDDGTLWLNLGDCYASGSSTSNNRGGPRKDVDVAGWAHRDATTHGNTAVSGLKPKDLIGIPWRVAFALQADGWYLRSDIVWAKPNPMPESVTDRPTKAHEYVFLLTKKPRYFYDAEAVREPHKEPGRGHGEQERNHWSVGDNNRGSQPFVRQYNPAGRNLRSVWTIPTQGFRKAHFATFPEKLVAICLNAGTSSKGCCPECGAPWRRVVERIGGPPKGDHRKREGFDENCKTAHKTGTVAGSALSKIYAEYGYAENRTVGWEPGCECFDGIDTTLADRSPIPCTVLDPFIGSGTTGVVAKQLGLRFVGIDASKTYLDMARRRIENPNPEPDVPEPEGQLTFAGDKT